MRTATYASAATPRIVPTPSRIRALEGSWMLYGEIVTLLQEPQSGVLLAMNAGGEMVNPLRVITRGKKLDESSSN